MRVVYLDELFFFNFTLNYLLLAGTARLLREHTAKGRRALGAAAGALYAVFCYLPGMEALSGMPQRIISGLCLVLVTFGFHNRARFAKRLAAFFALAAALGGGVLGLYFLIGDGSSFSARNGVAYLDVSFLFFACAFAVIYPLALLSYRLFAAGQGVTQSIAAVAVTIGERSISCRALVDTGCCIREPMTGSLVVVIARKAALPLLDEHRLPPIALIPFQTIGGSGLLPAVRSCRFVAEVDGRRVEHRGVYLALSDCEISPDGSYEMLLPHDSLLSNQEEGSVCVAH